MNAVATYSIPQLREMLRNASSLEELNAIQKLIPPLSKRQREEGRKRLDDGIYDSHGTLIGELHPED
ncbi:MAG: hypothetical protein ACI4FX_03075 [Agathobacter sp.]